MTMTNNYNLPEPLFKALDTGRRKPEAGRIWATHLIDAPLRRVLLMKHFDEIVEDASDSLYSLLGKGIHAIIEHHGTDETSERKMECKHSSGATLVTVADYFKDNVITDWKVVSVWAFLLSPKEEWHNQLEVLRYIYEKNGERVDALRVYAILRDHMKSKSYEADYPSIPFVPREYKLWFPVDLENYIAERCILHLNAEALIDTPELIPPCTSDERWERPTVYALKKEGQKKAVKLYSNPAEATAAAGAKPGLYVELRKGASPKCESYCAVMPFCPYKDRFVKANDNEI